MSKVATKETMKELKTLLIGDMAVIDRLYYWMEISDEPFDVELIISLSDNPPSSGHFSCPVEPVSSLEFVKNIYDRVFICSNNNLYEEVYSILMMLGIDAQAICSKEQISRFLKRAAMAEKEHLIDIPFSENIHIGSFSYGTPVFHSFVDDNTSVQIGKFCSIANGVAFVMGGEHHSDWCTTYPFTAVFKDFPISKGDDASKGDIIIGNDV